VRSEDFALLVERRRKLVQLIASGMSVNRAAKVLSEEFHVSERQIWKDWRSMDTWASALCQFGNEQKDEIFKYLIELDGLSKEVYRIYLAAKNDYARVGAVGLYLKTIVTNIKVRQKLGLLPNGLPKTEPRIIMIQGRFCAVSPDGKATPVNSSKGQWVWQEDADQQTDGPGLPAP
jgi:hypothetical protein